MFGRRKQQLKPVEQQRFSVVDWAYSVYVCNWLTKNGIKCPQCGCGEWAERSANAVCADCSFPDLVRDRSALPRPSLVDES